MQRAKENEGNVITNPHGAAFPGDLRSTSGLGTGDGIQDHTGKWLQVCLSVGSCASSMQLARAAAVRSLAEHAPLTSLSI